VDAETEDDSFNDRLAKLAAPMLKVFQEPETMETTLVKMQSVENASDPWICEQCFG